MDILWVDEPSNWSVPVLYSRALQSLAHDVDVVPGHNTRSHGMKRFINALKRLLYVRRTRRIVRERLLKL